jgi:hypothetical protein
MGARLSVAEDQTPLGVTTARVVTVDEEGNELAREVVGDAPGARPECRAVRRSGRRPTRYERGLGDMSLSIPGSHTLDELRAELREMIFEDELREVDEELADEPRWRACRRCSESVASSPTTRRCSRCRSWWSSTRTS